jgi:uncharacterized protein involved in cysteine biosynthesis
MPSDRREELMQDPDKSGDQLGVVILLQILALLELLGGAWLLSQAESTSVQFVGTTPITSSEHDWAAGLVYLGAAIFVSALLFGFAHLIQDVHDMRRQGTVERRPDAG